MKQSSFKITSVLSMIALFSVGFASWYIDGNIETNTKISGTIETGDVEISDNTSYYDLKLTKVIQKDSLEKNAKDQVNNSDSIEIFDADFKWSNKKNSNYSSALTTYFDIFDSNNPIGDTSPRIISLDTGDTISLPMHMLDAENSTIRSSMYYSNSYHIIDGNITDDEKNSLKNLDASSLYDSSDEKKAQTDSATIETKTNVDIGNDNFRLDIRRLVKDSKYYYYRFYLFYYTSKTPRQIEKSVSTQISAFSSALTNSSWPSLNSKGSATIKTTDKKISTVQIIFDYTDNSKNSKTLTTSFSSACYTNTSEYYSKTIDNTLSNYNIYKPINEQMPFYSYATVTSSTSTDLTWAINIRYFREEEKNMATASASNIKTPVGYDFLNASWRLVKQIQPPQVVAQFVNSNDSKDVIERTFNLYTGVRTKSYFYKELNLINRNEMVFVYIIRLRPKANYVNNAKEIINSFNYSINYTIETKVI